MFNMTISDTVRRMSTFFTAHLPIPSNFFEEPENEVKLVAFPS